MILTEAGMRVAAFTSGKELPERLREEDPDLLVMDEVMAESEGFESFRETKRFSWNGREIPVIIVTEDGSQESGARALARGAEDIIRRQTVPAILIHRVEQTIELNRLRTVVEEAAHRR